MLQRDFEADGGLTPIERGPRARPAPTRALDAIAAVLEELDLGKPTRGDEGERARRLRLGRDATAICRATWRVICEAIKARGITVVDVIKALAQARLSRGGGEPPVARASCAFPATTCRPRRSCATAACISAVNDPNDYRGPGTGYRLSRGAARGDRRDPRRARPRRGAAQAEEFAHAGREATIALPHHGPGRSRQRSPREVVIGVSPGVRHQALPHARRPSRCRRCCSALIAGIDEQAAASARIVRMQHTADTSFLGLTAARLAGSGVGIGIQAKGTAVIHQARPPAAQQSRALLQRADHHARALPRAWARTPPPMRWARLPEPVVVPTRGRGDGLALSRARRADLRDRDRR